MGSPEIISCNAPTNALLFGKVHYSKYVCMYKLLEGRSRVDQKLFLVSYLFVLIYYYLEV